MLYSRNDHRQIITGSSRVAQWVKDTGSSRVAQWVKDTARVVTLELPHALGAANNFKKKK